MVTGSKPFRSWMIIDILWISPLSSSESSRPNVFPSVKTANMAGLIDHSIVECAKFSGRSINSVRTRAFKLKLRRVKAARDLISAPDLQPFHDRICAYIRDHGGLVFAYSPQGTRGT